MLFTYVKCNVILNAELMIDLMEEHMNLSYVTSVSTRLTFRKFKTENYISESLASS